MLPAPSLAERKIALSSKGHCTAHSVLGDGIGVRMQAESWLEQCSFYILNAQHDVASMREQVFFYFGAKRERHHIFDVVVTLRDKRQIAYTIKPENRTKSRMKHQMPGEDFLSHMQAVAWWVREIGFADDTRLISDYDLDPVELHNARTRLLFSSVARDGQTGMRATNRSRNAELPIYESQVPRSKNEQRRHHQATDTAQASTARIEEG